MKTITTLLAGLIALAVMAPASFAQSNQPAHDIRVHPPWTQGFTDQMQMLLTTGDSERMEVAMQLIIQYGKQSKLPINFNPLIPTLFDIFESESMSSGQRLLTLSALEAIGSEVVMERLAERLRSGREQSEHVKQQTIRVLTVRMLEAD